MKIAFTDTGRADKQKLYIDWLRRIDPTIEAVVLSSANHSTSALEEYDGLVLTGGGDVHPKFYQQETDETVKRIDEKRDLFEFSLIESGLRIGLPILGICRGLQVVNVFLGGTLYKDVLGAGYQNHTEVEGKECRHSLEIEKDSFLHNLMGADRGDVNSFHHQSADKIGKGLKITSRSIDGVVESLEWKEKDGRPFFLLVQWHPERMNDSANPLAVGIGKSFLLAVTLNKQSKRSTVRDLSPQTNS